MAVTTMRSKTVSLVLASSIIANVVLAGSSNENLISDGKEVL